MSSSLRPTLSTRDSLGNVSNFMRNLLSTERPGSYLLTSFSSLAALWWPRRAALLFLRPSPQYPTNRHAINLQVISAPIVVLDKNAQGIHLPMLPPEHPRTRARASLEPVAPHGRAAAVVPLEHLILALCPGERLKDVLLRDRGPEDVVEEPVKGLAHGGEAVVLELVKANESVLGQLALRPLPDAIVDFPDADRVCEGDWLLVERDGSVS